MNTQKGVKGGSPRPRREKPMLDRALQYAKLYNGGKGMKASDIGAKFNENDVTVYKLIRLGEAPKSVIALIRKDEVPATVVANALKSSMTNKEVIETVNSLVKERAEARKKLHDAGFRGASSMTVSRAFKIALQNLKKRHMIRSEGQKAVVRVFNEIFSGERKPSVRDIEQAILLN